ncbi:VanW family protein [Tsukamurella tyrosinosolvens]|uniref:VanW family protein n=1 Tax=Tsukamurella tyrosinosolvens TaxID=57704 RepID=UPI001AF41D15|nr:VanW family protein [Tsukamurella tyrosinosolvens]QRY83094.1 VanW family protein [Tsukamurella tyrosinosolvens]
MTPTRTALRRAPALALVVALLLGAGGAAVWESGRAETVHGATAVGVEFGALGRDDATHRLDDAAKRVDAEPITLRTAKGEVRLQPAQLGLSMDVPGTVQRAIDERSPLRDLIGLVRDRHVHPASTLNRQVFDAAITKASGALTSEAGDGAVIFRGGKPVAVEPKAGDKIDLARAAEAVAAAWPDSTDITVPTEAVRPTVSVDVVRAVASGAAAQAVASDVVLRRDAAGQVAAGTVGRVTGTDIGTFLSFQPDGAGNLAPKVDREAAKKVLGTRLESAVAKPKDASFDLSGGTPTVTEAVPGREVVWDPTLDAVTKAVTEQSAQGRTATAQFKAVEPKVSTAKAKELGVREVVSEFSTGGFSDASGVNIRRVAQQVNGAVVLPGETFSLNGYTGPRGTAQGYVESGIINNGRPDKAVGGGISQFATTLYNAAYFAGLEDAGHTEHSYYISRYPEAREATVFEGAIDLQFRNDTPYGVVIESSAGSSSVSVRMWSTKTREVSSSTGSRSLPTQPSTIRLAKGPHCVASTGQPGFTTSNTRTITDVKTGSVLSRHTRTVKYDPVPTVICE